MMQGKHFSLVIVIQEEKYRGSNCNNCNTSGKRWWNEGMKINHAEKIFFFIFVHNKEGEILQGSGIHWLFTHKWSIRLNVSLTVSFLLTHFPTWQSSFRRTLCASVCDDRALGWSFPTSGGCWDGAAEYRVFCHSTRTPTTAWKTSLLRIRARKRRSPAWAVLQEEDLVRVYKGDDLLLLF